jgi:hypothetical protein
VDSDTTPENMITPGLGNVLHAISRAHSTLPESTVEPGPLGSSHLRAAPPERVSALCSDTVGMTVQPAEPSPAGFIEFVFGVGLGSFRVALDRRSPPVARKAEKSSHPMRDALGSFQ